MKNKIINILVISVIAFILFISIKRVNEKYEINRELVGKKIVVGKDTLIVVDSYASCIVLSNRVTIYNQNLNKFELIK